MVLLNVPPIFMLDNLLQKPGFSRLFVNRSKNVTDEFSSHISVTLPLEQEIPSQEVHGSVDPVQLCGSFCQFLVSACSAATVELIS